MQLILGSQSPRRKEILSYFNLPFKQMSPPFDEEAIPFEGDPIEYVRTLSIGKADSLGEHLSPHLIITADTTVHLDGKLYGKPKDEREAFRMLTELSGQWHSVFTGITVRAHGQDFSGVEETRVRFNDLTEGHIRSYLHSFDYLDKAGAYQIQGAGGLIVKEIQGCYFNVVGLPINLLCLLMQQAGVDLWKHLKKDDK